MDTKRQQKIHHMFNKPRPKQNVVDTEAEERMSELLEDNKKLKKLLMERESYAFQLERSLLPQPRLFHAKHQGAINNEISSLGGEAVMRSKIAKQRERLETYLRLFGIQVKAYTSERCVLLYDIRIKGELVAQYAIQFTKPPGGQDWSVFRYHLPLGLSLDILSEHQVMSLEYVRQLQVALVAHHDRRAQINQLKEEIPSHVFVNHNMLGTSIELIFPMVEKNGTGVPVNCLELQYDPFQNRPKQFKIIQKMVLKYSEEHEAALTNQFEIMKYLSLPEAFANAVSKDSENNFYCPSEDEQENLGAEFEQQDYAGLVQQRNKAAERRQYNTESEQDVATTKKSHKKQSKQTNNVHHIEPQSHEESDIQSDDESISFTTLRKQMKVTKQQLQEGPSTFKKPTLPKTGSKRAPPRNEIEQYEDDTDSYTTEILREPNKKRRDSINSGTSGYQVTDNDLTTGSYVFIPESKKKTVKTSTAKKGKANISVGKENGKKKGKSKK